MADARWAAARRVLAVRLDGMGDVLMTTPALRAVKAAGKHVTLLTSPAGAAVARLVPEIDDVIVYQAPWMKAGGELDPAADWAMARRLADGRFDAAIVFTVFSQNPLPAAFLCRLAGVPLALAHSRERAYRLLSNEIAETEPQSGIRHEARRQLDLVATLGWRTADEPMSLDPGAEARARAAALVDRLGLGERWVLAHPGATAPSRRYPIDRMAEALALTGLPVLVAGGRDDVALVAELQARLPQARVAPDGLTLADLAALIAAAPVFLGNNSGPAHIAAASATPSVVLYAQTNPQHTPWMAPATVLTADQPCRWCYKSLCPRTVNHCVADVPPEQVASALLDRLRAGRVSKDAAA